MNHEQWSDLLIDVEELETMAGNEYDKEVEMAKLILNATAPEHDSHALEVASEVHWLGHEFFIVGLLHDAIEDTPKKSMRKKLKQIILRFYGNRIFDAVIAITKRPHQHYFADYLSQVASNPVALQVKIADMRHNLKRTQWDEPSQERASRETKYLNGLKFLGTKIATRYHMEGN